LSRNYVISTAALIGLVAASTLPAWACRVSRPPVTFEKAKEAKEPNLGLVGRITATYVADPAQYGESIVRVEVTQDFTGKLPKIVYVLNPGCCVCVFIGGNNGDEVITIVRRGDDGLFYLAY
jgi:hypothetical protein